jgi:hypothetical protein
LAIAVSVAVALLCTGSPLHAEDGAQAPLRQEWVGIELFPVSLNVGTAPSGQGPSRFHFGAGATLRVLRHRWQQVYWTPLAASLFIGSGYDILSAQLQTEVGYIPPLGPRALELGAAVGAGILAIPLRGSNCGDGPCSLGGEGPMLSPVVRYHLADGPRYTLALVFRAVIPLHVPDGYSFTSYSGRAVLFLGGLDLAFGSIG